jgi:hypothetical protein
MRTTAWATTKLIGFHSWPNPPQHRDYLANRHRHLFHITVEAEITDGIRIEYHDLKEAIESFWYTERGLQSCEQIAAELLDKFTRNWLSRLTDRWLYHPTTVIVSEDGEAGSRIFQP